MISFACGFFSCAIIKKNKKNIDKQFYKIEFEDTHYGSKYRFVSLFNGTRGTWCPYKHEAIEQGEAHKVVILFLHNKKIENKNES
jgi:hypothetical protein